MDLIPAVSKAILDGISGNAGAIKWLQGSEVFVNLPGGSQENAPLTARVLAAAIVSTVVKLYADKIQSVSHQPPVSTLHAQLDEESVVFQTLSGQHAACGHLRGLSGRADHRNCGTALLSLASDCIHASMYCGQGPAVPTLNSVSRAVAGVPSPARQAAFMACAATTHALANDFLGNKRKQTPFLVCVAACTRCPQLLTLARQVHTACRPFEPRAGHSDNSDTSHAQSSTEKAMLTNIGSNVMLFDPPTAAHAGAAADSGATAKAGGRMIGGRPVGMLCEELASACIAPGVPTDCAACVMFDCPPSAACAPGSAAVAEYVGPVHSSSPQLTTLRALCTQMGWGWVYRTVIPQALWPAVQCPLPIATPALRRWDGDTTPHAVALLRGMQAATCMQSHSNTGGCASGEGACAAPALQAARAMRCLGSLMSDALLNATSAAETASVLRGVNNILARFVELLRQCAPVPLEASKAVAVQSAAVQGISQPEALPMVPVSVTAVQCGLPFICQLEMVSAIAEVWAAFKGSVWPSAVSAHALGGNVLPADTPEHKAFQGMNDELWEGIRISYATLRQAVWGASDWCTWLPSSVQEALPSHLLRCTLAPPRGAVGKVSDVQVPSALAKPAKSSTHQKQVGGGKRGHGGGASGRGGGHASKRGRGASRSGKQA